MYKIKCLYEDFLVRENIELNFTTGDYYYFLIEKKGLGTLDTIKLISQKLKLDLTRFGYAGLKDKNALTSQYISIFKPDMIILDKIDLKNLTLKFIGLGNKPISKGTLLGNDFVITVRNLDNEHKKISFIENYFDEQRFSSNNVDVGRNIVKRNYNQIFEFLNIDNFNSLKKNDHSMLRFYVNSYQSYLWNCVVADLLRKEKGYFEVDYSLGKFVFLNRKIKNFKVPLLNFDSKFESGVKLVYERIMKEEGISKDSFLIREFPELINETDYRDVVVDVSIKSRFENDELNKGKFKQILEFSLPKGSYATIVIKKMFFV